MKWTWIRSLLNIRNASDALASVAELRSAGLLNGVPVDPLGYPYVFGPDGKAELSPYSSVIIPQDLNSLPAASR